MNIEITVNVGLLSYQKYKEPSFVNC